MWKFGIVLACCMGCATTLFGQDAKKPNDQKKAYTSLNEIDADYHLQGEYAGCITRNGCSQEVGLQVVALGNGQFEALLHSGGLPGWGGQPKPLKLKGKRDGDAVNLVGENLTITLPDGRTATVTDSSTRFIGRLSTIHRSSPTMNAFPPPNATVLFNGSKPEHFKNATITDDGLLNMGTETVKPYGSFTLHAEFRTPFMPNARGQARGNSGFYLQKRYEVQVLDSFGLEPQFNDAGSLYRTKAPDVNMAYPPLHWQTYDIHFTAAKFDANGKKTSPTRITVWHNGIPVQNNFELPNKTGAGQPEGPNPMPILLQNHGDPVHFRNIWIVEHNDLDRQSSALPWSLASVGLKLPHSVTGECSGCSQCAANGCPPCESAAANCCPPCAENVGPPTRCFRPLGLFRR